MAKKTEEQRRFAYLAEFRKSYLAAVLADAEAKLKELGRAPDAWRVLTVENRGRWFGYDVSEAVRRLGPDTEPATKTTRQDFYKAHAEALAKFEKAKRRVMKTEARNATTAHLHARDEDPVQYVAAFGPPAPVRVSEAWIAGEAAALAAYAARVTDPEEMDDIDPRVHLHARALWGDPGARRKREARIGQQEATKSKREEADRHRELARTIWEKQPKAFISDVAQNIIANDPHCIEKQCPLGTVRRHIAPVKPPGSAQ